MLIFLMFILGYVTGAGMLAALIMTMTVKVDPFKAAVLLLLMAAILGQWIIADSDRHLDRQYQSISGGKGNRP